MPERTVPLIKNSALRDSQELLKSFFLAFLFISVPRGLLGYMFLGSVLMLREERL